jgi:hypothetical protein
MLVPIDQHILQALGARPSGSPPMTIGDLARDFGLSPLVAVSAARRLVESGQAAPSMVSVHGVPTLRGLLPMPATTPS